MSLACLSDAISTIRLASVCSSSDRSPSADEGGAPAVYHALLDCPDRLAGSTGAVFVTPT